VRDASQLVQFIGRRLEAHRSVFGDRETLAWQTHFIAEDILVCGAIAGSLRLKAYH
jgi:hypothetical protein